jgi:hypothetical protein
VQQPGLRYYSSELGRWVSRDPIGEDGGENVYLFVLNFALSGVDPDGRMVLFPTFPDLDGLVKGTCGEADITASVWHVLAKMESDFSTWTDKRCRCNALYDPDTAGAAWDIWTLFGIGRGGWPDHFSGSCGSGGGFSGSRCERTIVYDGKCHYGGSANYLQWGVANRLCHREFPLDPRFSRLSAKLAVVYHKWVSYWGALTDSAVMFTGIGYSGRGRAKKLLPQCKIKSAPRALLRPNPKFPSRSYFWINPADL